MDNDFHVKESPMPTMIGLGGGATGLSISGLAKPTEALYTNPGSYSWECPAGVTSVSVVVVGSGEDNFPDVPSYNFEDVPF